MKYTKSFDKFNKNGSIKDLLSNLEDYYLHSDLEDDGVLEYCDDIYDLYHEIQINIYTFDDIKDINDQEYLKDIADLYILKKDGQKVYLCEFLPFVYFDDNGDYAMEGENEYIM